MVVLLIHLLKMRMKVRKTRGVRMGMTKIKRVKMTIPRMKRVKIPRTRMMRKSDVQCPQFQWRHSRSYFVIGCKGVWELLVHFLSAFPKRKEPGIAVGIGV